jgi:NADPH-dependent 2,4-dienoyl-CoA reductase/sulfur reductase-like enzyme
VRRVVVVGASVAGVQAVDGLRESGFDGDVVLIGAENRLPYDRPPLSKKALLEGLHEGEALLRPAEWYPDHGVELRLGRTAVRLDVASRVIVLDDGHEVGYDGLILATGSTARRLPDGEQGADVHLLRTAEDCTRLHEVLLPDQHLVVIGAGFIGLEVAATARQLGMDVTVVELAPVPLARVLGDEVGAWFQAYHERNGVVGRCGNAVSSIEPVGTSSKVQLRDGTVLAADAIIAGVGSVPAIDWLRDSGLRLSDGVVCDAYLHTSAPGVVAAGDIVRWYNPLFDEDLRIEQWTNAVDQGHYAAASLLGKVDAPYSAAPYFWSDQFSAKMRFVGRANAAQHIQVRQSDDRRLVVAYGRDGFVRGALCVNAPRELVALQRSIIQRIPWDDAVPV